MCSRLLLALVFFGGLSFGANVFTLNDQFNVVNCQVPPPASDPNFNNCDTIGEKSDFDIEKAVITFSGTLTTIDYYLNYRNTSVNAAPGVPLGSFNVGTAILSPGDIFFNGSGGTLYGLALSNHDGFALGGLYAIGGGVTTRTAANVLNLPTPPWYYRRNEKVWLGGAAPSSPVGLATVGAATNGPGAEFKVSIVLDSIASSALYTAADANGGSLQVQFASLTCANDLLTGDIYTPEPSSYVFMSTLMAFLGVGIYRRRRPAATVGN